MLHTTPKQSAIWYICEIQFFLLCDFAPLQIFKETTEVATGAKVSQIHYSKTTTLSCPFTVSFTTLWIYTTPKPQKKFLKLLPVYVSQDIKLHFIISLPFCQKNILSAMLVQICSTTLQSCTSSNAQIGIWSCYRHKKHAITLLQNYDRVAAMYVSVLLPYEFTLLQNNRCQANKKIVVLLPYEFTLLQNLKRGYLKLLPVYVSQNIQLHFIISLPFCPKNILSAMLVQICSTTLRSCTSSNAQIGIWSCYWRKSLANTLLQNCEMVIEG